MSAYLVFQKSTVLHSQDQSESILEGMRLNSINFQHTKEDDLKTLSLRFGILPLFSPLSSPQKNGVQIGVNCQG